MYCAKEIAVFVGDLATIRVFEIDNIMANAKSYQFRHKDLAVPGNPTGVRIVNDRAYALTLAAGLAQNGTIG